MFDVHQLKSYLTNRQSQLIMFFGLSIMFIPTLWGLLTNSGLWLDDEHAHGPIILAVALWLIWTRWSELSDNYFDEPSTLLSWVCLFIAAALYIPGRALDIIYFETGAFVWALAGIILMIGGLKLLNKLKFPLFFMCFMIPLPNSLVGPLTGWMKLMVSNFTVDILSYLALPVAQNGVIITLGQYQLLVADACAGMRTLFMLEALGILYLNLVSYPSKLRNFALPLLIIPISFTANIIRVLTLSLITYYFGSAAGEGFLHGFAGMVLFLAGLMLMMATDNLLRFISSKFGYSHTKLNTKVST